MSYEQYLNIPQELRDLPQWVGVGPQKEPINPKEGWRASVTDPSTWGTFMDAIGSNVNGLSQGLGFVFTEQDPYVFIDLDNPFDAKHSAWAPEYRKQCGDLNAQIYHSLRELTYTEISQSGNGMHIIGRGSVPTGARKDTVEVYSTGRYAIFTGQSIGAGVIADLQSVVTNMYSQMHAIEQQNQLALEEKAERIPDDKLLELMYSAPNADRLYLMMQGDWKALGYPSASECDMALIGYLADMSPSNAQVERIYFTSELTKRLKNGKLRVTRKYFLDTLATIRRKQPPQVDLSQLDLIGKVNGHNGTHVAPALLGEGAGSVGSTVHSEPEGNAATVGIPTPLANTVAQEWTLPEGLMGRIAQYIHGSAHYPLRAAAIAGAISLMAGIAGRAYNINESGLNHYVMLLAPSGSGKESMARGIDKLLRLTRQQVPMANTFKGPAVFSSGQGLLKVVATRPCFLSILGEFGITLQRITSPHANGADSMSRQVLLDLYGKSGYGGELDEMAYSDREKNTAITYMPAISILGESVAEQFYAGLDINAVMAGLVPRFMIFETVEETFVRNRNTKQPPDPALIADLQKLCSTTLTMAANNSIQDVPCDEAGQIALDNFEVYCSKRRETGRIVEKDLWNRAHLKTMRLSALVAVGCNIDSPVITQSMVYWAAGIVLRTTERVLERFDNDEVGEGEAQQDNDLRKAIEAYQAMRPAQRLNSNCPRDCVADGIIPYGYLRKWLRARASFRNSRMPLDKAVDSIITTAVRVGYLIPVPPQKRIELGIRNDAWYINSVR